MSLLDYNQRVFFNYGRILKKLKKQKVSIKMFLKA